MPGFVSSISNSNEAVFAKNADFTGSSDPTVANGLQLNGQMWIGATALNAGGTHINVGNITSPGGSLSIGYVSPNITLEVAGGGTPVISITGGPGITITGTAAAPIVNSVVFTDRAAPVSVVKNSGSFSTGTVTLTTPVSAGLADGDLLEFVATTANVLTIQFAATQVGHIGNVASSAAGTFVSTAIGDAVRLRYQASTNDWWAISTQGNWTIT